MFTRTGWFGAALVAAALMTAGAGCGPDTKDDGAPPPSEQPATEGTMEGGEGGMMEPGTPVSEGGATDGAATDGATTEGGGATEGGTPGSEGGATEGGATEGGSTAAGAPPAGAGMETPAAEAGTITVSIAQADGGFSAQAKVGADAGSSYAVAIGQVPQDLLAFLKQKREELTAAGQQPKVVVTAPLEVPFEAITPVIKAAVQAGFGQSEVKYQPMSK